MHRKNIYTDKNKLERSTKTSELIFLHYLHSVRGVFSIRIILFLIPQHFETLYLSQLKHLTIYKSLNTLPFSGHN